MTWDLQILRLTMVLRVRDGFLLWGIGTGMELTPPDYSIPWRTSFTLRTLQRRAQPTLRSHTDRLDQSLCEEIIIMTGSTLSASMIRPPVFFPSGIRTLQALRTCSSNMGRLLPGGHLWSAIGMGYRFVP